jgi:hypothetical protein
MRAGTRALLWAGLVTGLVCARAWGDGMVLVETPSMRLFSEQYQGAVVTVHDDRTAGVELFVSLASSSAQPQRVQFLLPLQTVPRAFRAREQAQQEFAAEVMAPLDEVLQTGAANDEERERSRQQIPVEHALLLGPWGLWALLSGTAGGAGAGGLQPPAPVLSAVTQHARADIYASLQPDQLARLAGLADLPDQVRQTLQSYAGRPFALVELHLLPLPPVTGKPRPDAPPLSPPGVRFTFTQRMLPNRDGTVYHYDFPLGTGRAWAHPIAWTVVYVAGARHLNLHVQFPDRPLPEAAPMGKPYDSETWAEVARGQQVYVATYGPDPKGGNPARDVVIELHTTGPSPLVARLDAEEQRADRHARAYCYLALLAWVAACLVFVPWGRSKGLAGRIGMMIACWPVAWVAQLVLFGVAGIFLLPITLWGTHRLGLQEDTLWPPLFVVVTLGCLTAAWWTTAREPLADAASAVWRLPLAGITANLIYLGLGYVLRVVHVL